MKIFCLSRDAILPILTATFFLCFVVIPAYSQKNSTREIIQRKVTSWSTDEGLPSNSIIYLHQDKDGYLWIGSYDGLIRFDGNQFTVYNKNNTPDLTSFHARTLGGDREGNLWIGTGFGLVKHNKGKFTNLAGNNYNFFVESMLVDEENHVIWIGTRNAGLFVYDILKNTYKPINTKFSKDLINSIVRDNNGGIWVGSEKYGLGYFKNDRWEYYGQKEGLINTEITSLYLDPVEGLIVGTTSGMYMLQGNGFKVEKRFEGIRINKVKKDDTGNLWVLTVGGVDVRGKDGTWTTISKKDGLSNNDVRDALVDSEGTVWLATYRGGLNQVREVKFKTFSAEQGLTVEAIGAIQQLNENKYITATTDGKVFIIENNVVSPFPLKTIIKQRIYSILQDHKMNLWFASYDGLLLITPDGKEKLFTEKDGLPTLQLRSIIQDRKQNFWIGSRTHGIIKMEFKEFPNQPEFEHFQYEKLSTLGATFIMSIEEDNKGNLTVGSNTGGLIIIAPDSSIKNYSVKEGLSSNVTYSARTDSDGIVWIATSDGIGRLENDSIFNFTRKDGLPQESVFDIVEDDQGYCWLPVAKGIIRVQKKQLNDYKEGTIKTIDWKLYDKNDDLIKSECTGSTRMFKDSNGNLWFLMLDGLVTVDPSDIQTNKLEPKVFIESLSIDDKSTDLASEIVIPAGAQRVAFTFTALTLKYPKSARYKYKLDNFDRDWVDAGKDRQAVYTNLQYGTYSFTVIACNNDGTWNTTGASISFNVQPHYYQAWWFYILVALMFGSGIFVYIRWRTRGIKLRSIELKKLVDERTQELALQRDELVVLNEEIRSSQEEIMAQRDSLEEKNEEIAAMNANLEKIVAYRTQVLEEQNKKLAEYAFINAHKLRGPLASILGLINLMVNEKENDQQQKLLFHLKKSSVELDEVVRSINRMLEKGFDNEPPV